MRSNLINSPQKYVHSGKILLSFNSTFIFVFFNPGDALLTISIIFFIAITIQVVFLTVFLVAFSKEREVKNFSAPVSIIVCAHDEEQNLRELIPILLEQDYPNFEILVVNDRSNDATFEFLLKETKANARLRMVNIERVPAHADAKKYAITLGIKAAQHEWILLTDADCRPENKHWIRSMANQFSDTTKIVIGYSPYMTKPGFLNKFIRFESLITAIQYISFALLKNPYMGVGRNLAYRKSFFLDNKGFNNLLPITGGDDDLFVNQHATASNTAVSIGTDSNVYSVPKTTMRDFFNQKVRHLSVGKRYRFKHRVLLGMFTISWLISWFVGIPLLFIFQPFYWIAVVMVIRIILLIVTTQTAAKRLGHRFEAWPVLLLDFIYSIYYLSTGLAALLTQKVKWKN